MTVQAFILNIGAIGWGLLLAAMLTISHIILKWSSKFPAGGFEWGIRVTAALGLYFIVFILYSFLLKSLPISRLYPIYTGLSVLLVFISGLVIFGETASAPQIAGMLLLIAGVALMARN